jgi:hypothetical protein
MTVTPKIIADFVCWLAEPPTQEGKVAIDIYLKPTAEQVTLLYGAWKALTIMEKLAGNSDDREEAIGQSRALFERLLGQCAYEKKPKPDATIDINTEDLPALRRAAVYLTEFQFRKLMEDEADARRSANRGNYKGTR